MAARLPVRGRPVVTLDTCLANLPAKTANQIILKLQFNCNWIQAAAECIRSDGSYMFDMYHLDLLGQNGTRAAHNMFGSLMTEGYTLQQLLDVVTRAQLYNVADFISVDVLSGNPVVRLNPRHGAGLSMVTTLDHVELEDGAAGESTDASSANFELVQDNGFSLAYASGDPESVELNCANASESSDIDSIGSNKLSGEAHHFSHHFLEDITDSFNETPLKKGGRLIGEGGYGHVFHGRKGSLQLAVKRLQINNSTDFHTEIKTLAGIQHENILKLIGYSDNGSNNCIVYAYMSNGSLEAYLSCKDKRKLLSVKQRLDIAIGIACGLHHLHTRDPPIIHRDVKSANVLLDDKLLPKLGDFGIARIFSTTEDENKTSTQIQTIRGTRVYIAPEIFQYMKVSPKADIYSFGVILYELLTGLKPFDGERDIGSLPMYIDETCGDDLGTMMILVDKSVNEWTEQAVGCLFALAQKCLDKAKKRPDLLNVIETIQSANGL